MLSLKSASVGEPMMMRCSFVSTFFSRLISSCAGMNDQPFILSADSAGGQMEARRRAGRQREVSEDKFSLDDLVTMLEPPTFYPALPLISGSTSLLSQHLDLRCRPLGQVRTIGAHPDGSLCCTQTDGQWRPGGPSASIQTHTFQVEHQ